MKYIRK